LFLPAMSDFSFLFCFFVYPLDRTFHNTRGDISTADLLELFRSFSPMEPPFRTPNYHQFPKHGLKDPIASLPVHRGNTCDFPPPAPEFRPTSKCLSLFRFIDPFLPGVPPPVPFFTTQPPPPKFSVAISVVRCVGRCFPTRPFVYYPFFCFVYLSIHLFLKLSREAHVCLQRFY